jgi:hypothetical protein
LVPFAAIFGRTLSTDYFATSDLVLIESRVRDVGGRHTPLVGAYSRYGWNHPGPLLFDALALPYRLLGSSGSSLLAAGVALNLLAAIGCLWMFWRRGGTVGLAFGTLVLLLLLRSLAVGVLAFPWNPYAIVLPFMLLVLVAWSIICGDDFLLPLAAAIASFCVQSHAGTVAVAAVVVAVAVVAFAVHVRQGRARSPLRTAVLTGVVAIVLWIPPIIEEFTSHGGNLSALWRYWTGSHSHRTGWARGARIVNAQFAIPGPWMSAHERTAPFAGGLDPRWHIPWTLILLVAAGIFALRRRDWPSLSLVAIVVLTAITAVASASQIVDEPYPYLLRWTWTLGALAWIAIGWTVLRALTDQRLAHVLRPAAFAAAGLGIILVVATTVTGRHAQLPDPQGERAVRALYPALLAAARNRSGPFLIEYGADLPSISLADAVFLQLNKDGIDARLDKDTGTSAVGAHHTIAPHDARTTIVAAANEAVDVYDANPAFNEIARYDSLDPQDRAFVSEATDQMLREAADSRGRNPTYSDLAAWEIRHPKISQRLNELNNGSERAAVYISVPNP